jgi:hypothetical protein
MHGALVAADKCGSACFNVASDQVLRCAYILLSLKGSLHPVKACSSY